MGGSWAGRWDTSRNHVCSPGSSSILSSALAAGVDSVSAGSMITTRACPRALVVVMKCSRSRTWSMEMSHAFVVCAPSFARLLRDSEVASSSSRKSG